MEIFQRDSRCAANKKIFMYRWMPGSKLYPHGPSGREMKSANPDLTAPRISIR